MNMYRLSRAAALYHEARQRMIEAEETMHSAPRGTSDYACFVAGLLAERYDEAVQNFRMREREWFEASTWHAHSAPYAPVSRC